MILELTQSSSVRYSSCEHMMDAEEFHYFGEFSLDGVTYIADCPKEGLVHIRDELQLLEDDIIVATYPKAGKTAVLMSL